MSQFGGQGSNSETQKQNMENISMSSDVIRIMPAGDSITFGMGDTGGYRKYLDYFLKEKGYTNFDFVGPEGKNSASFNYNGKSVTYDDNHAGYSGYTIIKQQGGYGGGLYDVLKETDAVKKTQPPPAAHIGERVEKHERPHHRDHPGKKRCHPVDCKSDGEASRETVNRERAPNAGQKADPDRQRRGNGRHFRRETDRSLLSDAVKQDQAAANKRQKDRKKNPVSAHHLPSVKARKAPVLIHPRYP